MYVKGNVEKKLKNRIKKKEKEDERMKKKCLLPLKIFATIRNEIKC